MSVVEKISSEIKKDVRKLNRQIHAQMKCKQ